jgi:hypothetical protein
MSLDAASFIAMNLRVVASTTHLATGDCSNTSAYSAPEAVRAWGTGRRSWEEHCGVLAIPILSMDCPSGGLNSLALAMDDWLHAGRVSISRQPGGPWAKAGGEPGNIARLILPRGSEIQFVAYVWAEKT